MLYQGLKTCKCPGRGLAKRKQPKSDHKEVEASCVENEPAVFQKLENIKISEPKNILDQTMDLKKAIRLKK